MDLKRMKATLKQERSINVTKIHSFLDLTRYYKRFIEGFSIIVTSLTRLTWKEVKQEWSKDCKESLEKLKKRLTTAPILTLLSGSEGFIVYNNTSNKGLRCVLMQDRKMIVYASIQLKPYKVNYRVHDQELAT